LATRHQVFALDPETGRELWRFGRYPADLDDTDADHENFANFNNHALYETRLVCTQTRGQAAALDIRSGQKLWEVELADSALDDHADLNDEFFLYHSMSAGRHIYPLLDADTGELLRIFQPPEDAGPPMRAVLLPEGIALIVTAQTFWAYDTASGQLLWSDRHAQRNAEATIQVGLDGVYLSQNRRHFVKRSLYDDRILWTSPPLRPDGGTFDTLAATLHGDVLYVVSEDAVLALDPTDGRILWEGATGGDVEFIGHRLAADLLMGIDMQQEDGRTYTAYFYDRRGGRIPPNGGVLSLGQFDHIRTITLRDRCLLLVDGQTVHSWVQQPSPSE
jgi:outer membrane protein assembly factor BamB